jgi:WhiB family redox-sensing transcriptional regulator
MVNFTVAQGPNFTEHGEPPCSQVSPEAFFPEEPSDEVYEQARRNRKSVPKPKYTMEYEAKKICSECPYRVDCLIFALKNNEPGIWGGTTEYERINIKRSKIDPASYRIRSRTKSSKKNKEGYIL